MFTSKCTLYTATLKVFYQRYSRNVYVDDITGKNHCVTENIDTFESIIKNTLVCEAYYKRNDDVISSDFWK